jgi:aryl sulfotransferase
MDALGDIRRIVWLDSYPKSGNTWMRAFLTNFLLDGDEPADINRLQTGGPIASAREAFDEAVGVEASDLTPEEIERYRPAVYVQMAQQSRETIYLKIHDAFTYTASGYPLVAKEATRGVLYLIRNPLDVAVSFAHHAESPVERTIAAMGDENYAFVDRPDHLYSQLRQRLLTWSGHVLSWVDEPGLDVHVVRYEDMVACPGETFAGVVRFAGLPEDPARIEKAIAFSSFDVLRQQEQEHGFSEKMPRSESFFRQGRTGSWRDALTGEQAARIIADHNAVMRRFGYLTKTGEPVF